MLRPKVLILYDRNGVCYWRSYLPGKAIQESGLAEVRFLELKYTTKNDLAIACQWSDIIVVVGLMDTNGLAMLRQYKNLGCKIAVDYDDLHFNVSPFNPAYRHFGLEEVEVKDPTTGDTTWLWRDGERGLDIKTNQKKFHAYKAILQEADVITTTTLYLKEALLEIADNQANVRVLPNALNLKEWAPLDIRDKFKDEFRFGWAVSGSHGEDWIYIKPVLHEFLKSHPSAKFVCIGDTYMDIREGLKDVADQIEWHPFSDLWEGHYPLRMAMLGLDVAIAPLADLEFNRCKSPLKFAEYTAFGYPVIAQNMTPYKEHIIHGQTGLLAGSKEAWLQCLEQLYKDKDLRRKLRFNALLSVKDMFDLEQVRNEWLDLFKQTIYREVKQ